MQTKGFASLFLMTLALPSVNMAAQNNAFPSSGNAGVGAGNSLNFANGLGHPSYVIGTWTDNNNSGLTFHAFGSATDITALSIQPGNGYVGIGTASPSAPLHINSVYTSATVGLDSTEGFLWSNSTNFSTASFAPTDNRILSLAFDPNTGAPVIRGSSSAKLGFVGGGWYFSGGNLGIGTTTPGAKLELNGNMKLTSGSGASITFADGTQQSTAWTGVLCGGDYAEAMNATGGKRKYEPGDVLVLASGDNSDVEKSAEPYSTMVAGIYATKPGVIGRRDALAKSSDDIPMAMVGVVPTKVSAENGPIHKGDLLVTSSTPGFAMKGTDRSRMLGAVIGKAMGTLDSGKGAVEVLVTLQ